MNLVDFKMDSTFKNQQWNSFMLACYFGKKDVVKLLLDHPRSQTIDFKAKDSNGDDAITITTKRGLKSLAQFLENHPTYPLHFHEVSIVN